MRVLEVAVALFSVTVALHAQAPCSTFSDAATYNGLPSEPHAIAVGDFNGDGKPDLAIGGKDTGTIQIFFGDGAGAFTESMQLDAKSPVESLIAADLNGDGRMDLAVAAIGGTVIFINHGAFFSESDYHQGVFPGAIAAADFNGDGVLDLVTANLASIDATVLLGNGDGTFHSAGPAYRLEARPESVAIADLNGDGKPDFAVVKAGSARVSIFLGNGDGTFTPGTDTFANLQPELIAAGDFNNDGKADLVVSYANTAIATIFFGNGDGTFSAPRDIPGAGALFVGVADINRDGKADLVFANITGGSNDIELLYGNGDGTFGEPVMLASPLQPSAIAAGDFNGDGEPDLAITNQGSNTLSVQLGQCAAVSRKHAVRH